MHKQKLETDQIKLGSVINMIWNGTVPVLSLWGSGTAGPEKLKEFGTQKSFKRLRGVTREKRTSTESNVLLVRFEKGPLAVSVPFWNGLDKNGTPDKTLFTRADTFDLFHYHDFMWSVPLFSCSVNSAWGSIYTTQKEWNGSKHSGSVTVHFFCCAM